MSASFRPAGRRHSNGFDAMTAPSKLKLAPYFDGWFAQRDGISAAGNPYDILRQPFSAGQWDAGWADRKAATKWGKPLEYDAEMAKPEWL